MHTFEVDISYESQRSFKCLAVCEDSRKAIEKAKQLPFEDKAIEISAYQLSDKELLNLCLSMPNILKIS